MPPEFVTSNSYYEHSTSKIVSSDDTHLSHNLEQELREGDIQKVLEISNYSVTDETMRCGVLYPLELCLHIPKYPTNPFYDEL